MRVYYYEKDNLKVKVGLARYKFAQQLIQKGVVLDLGCGARQGPKLLAKNADKVFGLDVSEEAIDYCKKHWADNKIEYLAVNAINLPFADSFFDYVVSFEVIEHIKEYQVYLNQIKRVLKENGTFIVSTPNRAVVSTARYLINPEHVQEFDFSEFKKLLESNFSQVAIYGQFVSVRVINLENCRQNNLRYLEKVPLSLKRLVPAKIKDLLLNCYHALSEEIKLGVSRQAVNENDFCFKRDDLAAARYFLAVCRK